MAGRLSQYGTPVFIKNFEAGGSAPLKPLQLSVIGSPQASYDEAWLQRLIVREPSLLPVHQFEQAFTGLVPICTELPTSSGPVDILFITPTGDIALVECKLWRNPEARRKVLAQIIDYATAMSSWSYEELQQAVKAAGALTNASGQPTTLYELACAKDEVDEAAFVDAVSRNLRRGRFLLLIVGDGIREGMEGMTAFLQQYAGLHFTLALVELAFFELPVGGYVAQPRVLAKTTNIERGIVSIDPAYLERLAIRRTNLVNEETQAIPSRTLTEELFLERLETKFPDVSQKLRMLFEQLPTYNLTPEFGTDSMILRWRPDTGNSWNVGTIYSSGGLSTDILGQQAKNAALLDEHKAFLNRLRALVPGASIRKTPKETAWYVVKDGKSVTIADLLANVDRMKGWLDAIAAFQNAASASTSQE